MQIFDILAQLREVCDADLARTPYHQFVPRSCVIHIMIGSYNLEKIQFDWEASITTLIP